MTAQMYKRILAANKSPINQACLKKLFQAKQVVDDSQVHLLQLANWGHPTFQETVPDSHIQYEVENTLMMLAGASPEVVMAAFYPNLEEEAGGEQERADDLLRQTPEDAAESVLEDLMCEVD